MFVEKGVKVGEVVVYVMFNNFGAWTPSAHANTQHDVVVSATLPCPS